MTFVKKNLILILAFALPLVFIIGVAISVKLSANKPTTTYNFIYATCSDGVNYPGPYCQAYLNKRYAVEDGKIVVHEVSTSTLSGEGLDIKMAQVEDSGDYNYTSRLFLHDTDTNESREVTLEEAETLTLNSLSTSPDGFTISGDYDRRGGEPFFIFGGYSNFGYYLKKGSDKKRLNLVKNNEYYDDSNFHFIGWVTK